MLNAAVAERINHDKKDPTLLEENPKRLVMMLLQGYTMVQMNDNVAKGTYIYNWENTIPVLPEMNDNVAKGMYIYDLEDTIPAPPEMNDNVAKWTYIYDWEDTIPALPEMNDNVAKGTYIYDWEDTIPALLKMNDNVAKGTYIYDWEDTIPALPEVTVASLKYDIADAERLAKKNMGCPIPIELKNFQGWTDGCNSIHDFHPKSLRSMFPYNTNLWATKNSAIVKKMGYVGLFDMNQDTTSTWISEKDPEHGSASFSCPHLEPWMLVRSRCSCKWAENATAASRELCQREEEVVNSLLKAKQMPVYDQTKL
eukprot:gene16729-22998_t